QHVLGHISLLGYNGDIIAPMCSGGPDEAALGDPVEVLMTEWARQCRAQGGLVVFPHFPNPRAENAATLIEGDADAVEMCSWGNLYYGIDPYSLSDWYRYLNCGHFYPAVGGTDKMTANTAVGIIRTYARIPNGVEFSYRAWMDAVRAGNTFVSYGPLMDFNVEGKSAGMRIRMGRHGGTVNVAYELASATIPMSRVELIVNGEIRESEQTRAWRAQGRWSVKLDRSSWFALLVRGHYRDKPEMIAAHSSPVMVELDSSPFFAAADAATILEQIEGVLAYIDTVGTRADDARYRQMRRVLTSAHRKLHNEMHRRGREHAHSALHAHAEHRH
ncbi:MAG: CehA/McbA family metallohydrolase, partial [Pseudomonadales bacterium]